MKRGLEKIDSLTCVTEEAMPLEYGTCQFIFLNQLNMVFANQISMLMAQDSVEATKLFLLDSNICDCFVITKRGVRTKRGLVAMLVFLLPFFF